MIRKLIAAFTLLLLAQPLVAQTFPVPSDIAAIYGPTGWIPSTATYAANGVQQVIGDGSNSYGGTPPAYATEPADIPTPSRTSWLVTGSFGPSSDYCEVGVELDINGNPCTEPKFRTHAMFSHVLFDDPVRNYGEPGTSHCHAFFGNRFANAYSTYQSLRNKRSSTASGGELNATAYWAPCPEKVVGGKTYVIKQDYNVIYYNTISTSERVKRVRIPRGFRYVLGFNMDDPDDSLVKKELAVANAQPGNAGRYSVPAAGYGHGIVGYQCVATTSFSKVLKNTDGTDPFIALPGGTCVAGSTLIMTIAAPECWDGQNLWSPGGYYHVRYRILDAQAPGDHLVCPNHWYQLPQLQLLFVFSEAGFADYGTWFLSSDAPAQTKLNSLPACLTDYSNAPCHEGGSARTIAAGESFHTDWLGAWDYTTMTAWQLNCLGLVPLGATTSHQCPPSIFSSTQGLSYTLPDGWNVRTSDVHGTGSTADMIPLASIQHGPMIMHNTPM